jgi:hypothetical protein
MKETTLSDSLLSQLNALRIVMIVTLKQDFVTDVWRVSYLSLLNLTLIHVLRILAMKLRDITSQVGIAFTALLKDAACVTNKGSVKNVNLVNSELKLPATHYFVLLHAH